MQTSWVKTKVLISESGHRKTLETIIQYEYEQGLIDRKVPVESLFAKSTVEGYKV